TACSSSAWCGVGAAARYRPRGWRRRRSKAARSSPRSAQLAVLAAAAVVAGEAGFFPVLRGLAGHAQAHAGYRAAPRLGARRDAFMEAFQAGPLGQARAGALGPVLDGRIDLIVDGVVAGPSGRHGNLLLAVRIQGARGDV